MSVRTALRRWRLVVLDGRVVTGIVLAAVSLLVGLRLAAPPEAATRVYAAAADLEAGHVLDRGDLTVVEVRGPRRTLGGLALAEHGPPAGRVISSPLRSGGLVSLDALGGAPAPGREITIPVTADHALGGGVRVGERLDVFATFDKGTDAARTVVVARQATVRSVTRSDGLFGQHDGEVTSITVSVQPEAAIALAFAARNAELDVVRAEGEARGPARFDADSLR